jgi:DNA-binding transcriptional MerR regulator
MPVTAGPTIDPKGAAALDKAPDAFRTISEVADDLKVPQHVLRFWESRFTQIKPMKRAGGRRYYRPDDVDLLRGIHHLLYGAGYTIRGVQRILRDQGSKFVQGVWQSEAEVRRLPDAELEAELSPYQAQTGPAARLTEGLPSLRRHDIPDSPQPTPANRSAADPSRAPNAMPGSGNDLSREELRRLQATLFELGECRRLLDAALDQKAS